MGCKMRLHIDRPAQYHFDWPFSVMKVLVNDSDIRPNWTPRNLLRGFQRKRRRGLKQALNEAWLNIPVLEKLH